MSDQQTASYDECAKVVIQLIQKAKRRPLTKEEQERFQRFLAMMRMICDSNYILDPNEKFCPKLNELEKIIDECQENDAKVIIFSEWERMLELVSTKRFAFSHCRGCRTRCPPMATSVDRTP